MKALAARADAARADAAKSEAQGRTHRKFGSVWNDALTALRWHGAPAPEYVTTGVTTFRDAGLTLRYPMGGCWCHEYSGDNDQLLLTIKQKALTGAMLCEVRIWTYRWDTVYSGIGGENYVKLAREMLEVDRQGLPGKDTKVSARVMSTSIHAHLPRAQFYFVEGYDSEIEGRLRCLNYYRKDDARTYNVEFIVRLDPVEDEDPLTSWQRTDDDPERAAFLKSLAPVEMAKGR